MVFRFRWNIKKKKIEKSLYVILCCFELGSMWLLFQVLASEWFGIWQNSYIASSGVSDAPSS